MKTDIEETWIDILRSLEEHHAVFYRLWQIGKPKFTYEVDTAAVQFDKLGKFVSFMFNPVFWSSLDPYNRLFVICHECLHLMLNHGVRIKDTAFSNRLACNQCLDVVVNHLLVDGFNFDRSKIRENYCWLDTVFPEMDVPKNETFEYYYNLFEKSYGDGFPSGEPDIVDDHDALTKTDNTLPINEVGELLTDVERSSLSFVAKHMGFADGSSSALLVGSPKVKKRWDSVIKAWSFRARKSLKGQEQWARLDRRLSLISSDLVLPSDMEVEDSVMEKRLKVSFFMDSSGSCWPLKQRFFEAALSLDKQVFDVGLFCFDVAVYAVSLEEKKVFGGGGTSFSCIESFLQEQPEYPHAVFLITDGYGESVAPQHPERWYWFLTENAQKNIVPQNSNVYDLLDFE